LTAAWGLLFGVTDSGDVLLIEESSGEGRRIRNFAGYAWYGAASAASR
jgi:hypothetical protein